MKIKIMAAASIAVAACGWGEPLTDSDPRTRTYAAPVRVVWRTPEAAVAGRCSVKDADSLLKRRHGQVPEGGWSHRASGCRLVNDGESPGVLAEAREACA